jgi:two-component system, sensor histidine kinase and response regulator
VHHSIFTPTPAELKRHCISLIDMDITRPGIVYLDDEEHNLISFNATFRKDFRVFVTLSPQEAAEHIRQNDIHIVVADQKMPEVSGVEFLEMIRHEFPDTIRILLTGYADIEAVIDAINRGQVFRYVQKPWNEGELKMLFDNAYELYKANRELRLRNEELARAYKELEKFVYSASHDIRSPLATIQSLVKLATIENDASMMPDYFRMIGSHAGDLELFTQNLITFYQNLRKDPIIRAVDLNEVITNVIHKLESHRSFSLVTIRREVSQTGVFLCDEDCLKVALTNMLMNSLKYVNKENPGPWISIRVLANESGVVIEISDNGLSLGNSLEHVRDLAEGKEWVGSSAGIGFFIIKKIIDKIGGKMKVVSGTDSGMTTEIHIPNKR